MPPDAATPIFIGGAPRSGLTLLRAMLDAHPGIACGPDLGAIPAIARQWAEVERVLGANLDGAYGLSREARRQSYAALIIALLEPLRVESRKRRVAEKTTGNALVFSELHALFPEAPLVHVVRDGRDVAASLLSVDWNDKDGAPLPYTRDPLQGARLWAAIVTAGRAAGELCGDRYIEIRYEALVTRPRETLDPLLAMIGERWDARLTNFAQRRLDLVGTETASAARLALPLDDTSIGRRRTLGANQAKAVEQAIGPVLAAFGYR